MWQCLNKFIACGVASLGVGTMMRLGSKLRFPHAKPFLQPFVLSVKNCRDIDVKVMGCSKSLSISWRDSIEGRPFHVHWYSEINHDTMLRKTVLVSTILL